jgi:hypothetical protein
MTTIDSPQTDREKEVAEEKGLRYVEQYVATPPSNDIQSKVFLKRNKKKMKPEQLTKNITIQNELECKICIATFKMFYVEDTEDLLFRDRRKFSKEERLKRKQLIEKMKKKRSKRWNLWLSKHKPAPEITKEEPQVVQQVPQQETMIQQSVQQPVVSSTAESGEKMEMDYTTSKQEEIRQSMQAQTLHQESIQSMQQSISNWNPSLHNEGRPEQ